ncbi:hypothetical protein N7474_004774 [Penicillium riverlandense]|uniref:uncharacterized protein n=1 Tax=Penicillium riverlandense TaxID=1903569 RepID=UPI0025466684|nr:uncharacterized protein N7474_004774 [Penicillium riverlandense]KAJ5819183.1 hypothetical protein N7474_004774 [Penicillium riverlandense]
MSSIQFLSDYHFNNETQVDFKQPKHNTWRIVQKLGEKCSRVDKTETNGGAKSYAAGLFLCENTLDTSRYAHMRIYMQVPMIGTEYEPPSKRAKQATQVTPREALAFLKFNEEGSTITPALLGYKDTIQDDDMPVPGEFLVILVWEIVPGLRLGDHVSHKQFLKLDEAEQNLIRENFLQGYKRLREFGFLPFFGTPKNLIWDRDNAKVYFVDFYRCIEVGPGTQTDDGILAAWHLKEQTSSDLK